MSKHHTVRWVRYGLLPFLAGSLFGSSTLSAADSIAYGGYQILAQFNVAPEGTVIRLPSDTAPGDLIWIRPLRLNPDEYLVLQKCAATDCSTGEVVRAWNTAGPMGPLGEINNKLPIKAGMRYMIFMQRIPVRGGGVFPQYKLDSPPLVFSPAGPARLFQASDVKASREKGLQRVTHTEIRGSEFVATFDGGSVVRLKVLRTPT
jgi:hypothetical protein